MISLLLNADAETATLTETAKGQPLRDERVQAHWHAHHARAPSPRQLVHGGLQARVLGTAGCHQGQAIAAGLCRHDAVGCQGGNLLIVVPGNSVDGDSSVERSTTPPPPLLRSSHFIKAPVYTAGRMPVAMKACSVRLERDSTQTSKRRIERPQTKL